MNTWLGKLAEFEIYKCKSLRIEFIFPFNSKLKQKFSEKITVNTEHACMVIIKGVWY